MYPPNVQGLRLSNSEDGSTFIRNSNIIWRKTLPLATQASVAKYLVKVWANEVKVREDFTDTTFYSYSEDDCLSEINSPLYNVRFEVYAVSEDGTVSQYKNEISAQRKSTFPFLGRILTYLDTSSYSAIAIDSSNLYVSGEYTYTDGSDYSAIAMFNKNSMELNSFRLFNGIHTNSLNINNTYLYSISNSSNMSESWNSGLLINKLNLPNLTTKVKIIYGDASSSLIGYCSTFDGSNLYVAGTFYDTNYYGFVQCFDATSLVSKRIRKFNYLGATSPTKALFNSLYIDGSNLLLCGVMDSDSSNYGVIYKINKKTFSTITHTALLNTICTGVNSNYIVGDYYNSLISKYQGWIGSLDSSLNVATTYKFDGSKQCNLNGFVIKDDSNICAYGRTYEGKFSNLGLLTNLDVSKIIVTRNNLNIKKALYDNNYIYLIGSCNFNGSKRTLVAKVSTQMEDVSFKCGASISLTASTPCVDSSSIFSTGTITLNSIGYTYPRGMGNKVYISEDPVIEVSSLGAMLW